MGGNVHGSGARARRRGVAALGACLLGLGSCVVLPVRVAPGIDGLVVDQATGKPVAGAVVVVRFDGRYDDRAPDRSVIAHEEAKSDARGRFRVERVVRPGVSVWPLLETEARVVGVMAEGYRCAAPLTAPARSSLRIELAPARDAHERRESCRPINAARGEVTAYMDAWRAMFADGSPQAIDDNERQVERVLEARTVLGFGENCSGPVTDLSVAPDGKSAAFRVAGARGGSVQRVELGEGAPKPVAVANAGSGSAQARLVWLSASELALVEPDAIPERALVRKNAPARVTRLGISAPAAPAPTASSELVELGDESDAFWGERSFALARTIDPTTGLAADELTVTLADGARTRFLLPGEACGTAGRFGQPQYRMSADGRSGVDLRYVGGGCHAVRIDFASGAWKKLDTAGARASCETARRVPAANLSVALRGYMREVESALAEGGADPAAAYALEIADDGDTIALARDFAGEKRNVRVPSFPLDTPLRRIDVSTIGLARPGPVRAPEPAPELEPL
jgi:hypothetical protein